MLKSLIVKFKELFFNKSITTEKISDTKIIRVKVKYNYYLDHVEEFVDIQVPKDLTEEQENELIQNEIDYRYGK